MIYIKPHPQEQRTVGFTFIITNGYKGKASLPGMKYDGTKSMDKSTVEVKI